jgi:hypothetical protein
MPIPGIISTSPQIINRAMLSEAMNMALLYHTWFNFILIFLSLISFHEKTGRYCFKHPAGNRELT